MLKIHTSKPSINHKRQKMYLMRSEFIKPLMKFLGFLCVIILNIPNEIISNGLSNETIIVKPKAGNVTDI